MLAARQFEATDDTFSTHSRDQVVRPLQFESRVEKAVPPPQSRTQALMAMRSIMKAAETCKEVGLAADRRAEHAKDIARQSLERLEQMNLELTETKAELEQVRAQSEADRRQVMESIRASEAEMVQMQDRSQKLDVEFSTMSRLFADLKTELADARVRVLEAEARARLAEEELKYLTDFACETLRG